MQLIQLYSEKIRGWKCPYCFNTLNIHREPSKKVGYSGYHSLLENFGECDDVCEHCGETFVWVVGIMKESEESKKKKELAQILDLEEALTCAKEIINTRASDELANCIFEGVKKILEKKSIYTKEKVLEITNSEIDRYFLGDIC